MIATLVVVAIAGAAGTWLARWVALRVGLVSHPNPIVPQHVQSIAYLGGIGIAIGFAVGVTWVPVPLDMLLGAMGFLALGTFDDARPLRPAPKLAGQLVVAALAVACSGRTQGPVELLVAVVWTVTVVNAVNLTDVCDGLVASLAIVTLAAAGTISSEGATFAWLMAAACSGFWAFNRAPASIFLGDGGSHLLGYAIATAWLATWQADPSSQRALAAILATGGFLLELGFLVVVRHRRGLAFWRGSPDHLALRLQAAGLSKHQTVGLAVCAALVLATLAIRLASRPSIVVMVIAALGVVVLVRFVIALYRREPVPRAGRAREEERG